MRGLWHRKARLLFAVPLALVLCGASAQAAGVSSDADQSEVTGVVNAEIAISAQDPAAMLLRHALAGQSEGEVTVTSTYTDWTVSIRDQDTDTPGLLDRTSGLGPLSLLDALQVGAQNEQTLSLTGANQQLFAGSLVDTFPVPFSQALTPGEDVLSGDGYQATVVYSVVASVGTPSPDPPEAPKNTGPPSLQEQPAGAGSLSVASLQSPSIAADAQPDMTPGNRAVPNPGTWTGNPEPTFSYSMYRCISADVATCTAIGSQTAYEIGAVDSGKFLRVKVTGSNSEGSDSAWSPPRRVRDDYPRFVRSPSLSGSVKEGQTAGASTGVAVGEPQPTYTLQWMQCLDNSDTASCTAISGATSSNFQPTSQQTGKYLRVKVRATNSLGFDEDWSAAALVRALGFKPELTAAPQVPESPKQGYEQSADRGSWLSDPAATYAYQWERSATAQSGDWTAIIGATSANFTPRSGDVGQYLRVLVAATNSYGSTTAYSPASLTRVTAAQPPANTSLPTVSGLRQEESTLTLGSSGQWSGDPAPTVVAYQWVRCADMLTLDSSCAAIIGASGTSYTLTSVDVGKDIRLRVTVRNVAGDATAYSAADTLITIYRLLSNDSPPQLVGAANRVGYTLGSTNGQWTQRPAASFSIAWLRCTAADDPDTCQTVSTSASRELQSADAGKYLRVRVTADNGLTVSALSEARLILAAVQPQSSSPPTISGSGRVSSNLNLVSVGTWSGDPAPSFEYQWQRSSDGSSWSNLSGATSSSFTVRDEDYPQQLRLRVAATNVAGTSYGYSSAITASAVKPGNVTAPVLSGSGNVGSDHSVTAGSWSGTPAPQLSYQWQRCSSAASGCSNISGATTNTYRATSSDYGLYLRASVSAANVAGSASQASQSTLVSGLPPTNTAQPGISGTAAAGQTLTAGVGTWTGSDPLSYGYLWQFSFTGTGGWYDISSATSSTYTVTNSDVGKYLRVRVTATNFVGSSTASSGATSIVTGPPVNTGLPAISGTTRVDSTLSSATGSWTGYPTPSISGRQWQVSSNGTSGWADIAGATSATFLLTSNEGGKYLRLKVTASNASGSTTAYSNATAAIQAIYEPYNTALPTASGTRKVGYTLTLTSRGSWAGVPSPNTSVSWQRCQADGTGCSNISGATSDTYTLQNADGGGRVKVTVTATNSVGSASETLDLGLVSAADLPSFSAVISGSPSTASTGTTLTALTQNLTGDPSPTVAYQWQTSANGSSGWSNISGATSSTYLLPAGALGTYVRVSITATNAGGSVSAASGAVNVDRSAPSFTTAPSVSGSGRVGEQLTAGSGTVTGTPTPTVTGTWQSAASANGTWSTISGSSGLTYTPVEADLGRYVRYHESASNVAGTATSASSAKLIVAAISNTALPTVSGTTEVGSSLSSSSGSWAGTVLSTSYQWVRCSNSGAGVVSDNLPASCSLIDDATASTYQLQSADAGYFLRSRVRVENSVDSVDAFSATTTSRVAEASALTATEYQVCTGGGTGCYPNFLATGPDGAMWVTNRDSGELVRIASNGQVSITGAGYTSPKLGRIVLGADNKLWVNNPRTNDPTIAAFSVDGNGVPTRTVSAATQGSTSQLEDIAATVGSFGTPAFTSSKVWFSEPKQVSSQGVGYFDNGGSRTTLATAVNDQSHLMTRGADNLIYSFTYDTAQSLPAYRVYRHNTNNTYTMMMTGPASPPSEGALGADKNLYYLLPGRDSLLKLNPANSATAEITSFGSSRGLRGLTGAPDGSMWTITSGNRLIRYGTSGADAGSYREYTISGLTDSGSANLKNLTFSDDGKLWLTAAGTGRVVRLTVPAIASSIDTAPSNTSVPTIGDTFSKSQTVKATVGGWSSWKLPVYSYQWQSNASGSWTDIAGATSDSYTIASADVTANLRVKVTATTYAGSTSAYSNQSTMVPAVAPANTAVPTISGTIADGSTLTMTSAGTWTGDPTPTYSYQWVACTTNSSTNDCSNISGATASSYVISTQANKFLRLKVTATNAAGSTSAYSAATEQVPAPPANTSAPYLHNVVSLGATLSDNSTWSGTPSPTITRQWQRSSDNSSWSDIVGSTGSTYATTSDDSGKYVRVTVTASNTGGSVSLSSNGIMVGAGTLWTPDQMANKVVWYKAESISGNPTNGSAISSWDDMTYNGRPATQSTASARPTYVKFGTGNRPAVRFDGNDKLDIPTTTTSGAPWYIFTVNKASSTTGLFDTAPNTAGTVRYQDSSVNVTSNSPALFTGVTQTSDAAIRGIYVSPYSTTRTLTTYYNGAQDSTASTTGNLALGINTPRIGAFNNGIGDGQFYNGDLSELVFLSGATLTTADRQNMEGYLAWKYGLQANLPSGHPFRSAPPLTSFDLAVTASSPIGYYKLDEAAETTTAAPTIGSTSLDIGSTITRRVSGAGFNTTAMSFPGGGNSYVRSLTTGLGANTGTNTMEAWIKPGSLPQTGTGGILLGNSSFGRMTLRIGQCGDGTGANAGSCLRVLYDGVCWMDSNWNFPDTTSWHHVVVARDGTTTRIYVDGSQKSAADCSPLYNATYTYIAGSGFVGAVDDAAFYNRALPLQEILGHYYAR